MFDFGILNHLSEINSLEEFWVFFNSMSDAMQVITVLTILGLLILVYIFIVALFSDKHI